MSYEEKGAWVYLVANVGAFGTYLAVIVSRAAHTPIAEVAYVSTLLWTIGIAIGVTIVGRIVVEIAKPSDDYQSDARDKEIHRFGEYVGGIVLAVAMILPFGLALADAASFWIANTMYLAFAVASLVSVPVKLVAYRRGL